MDRLRRQLFDPFCHFDLWKQHTFGCIVIDVLHAPLISLPTVFHSFGHMTLLDDDALALPENPSLECRLYHQCIHECFCLVRLRHSHSVGPSLLHCFVMTAAFVQNLMILNFSLIHVNFGLLSVRRIVCIRFMRSFLTYAYRVFSSDIGSAHPRHCDLPSCHRPWRLRIGSPSLARKSLHHSLTDLSHELPDVNLPIMAKDTYLNFGARFIKRPSLRPPHGDTMA